MFTEKYLVLILLLNIYQYKWDEITFNTVYISAVHVIAVQNNDELCVIISLSDIRLISGAFESNPVKLHCIATNCRHSSQCDRSKSIYILVLLVQHNSIHPLSQQKLVCVSKMIERALSLQYRNMSIYVYTCIESEISINHS